VRVDVLVLEANPSDWRRGVKRRRGRRDGSWSLATAPWDREPPAVPRWTESAD